MVNTLDICCITFNLNLASHTVKLINIFESVLKYTFSNHTWTISKCKNYSHLWLHICWKSRIRQCLNVSTLKRTFTDNSYPVISFYNFTANFNKLCWQRLKMLRNNILNHNVAISCRCCKHKRSSFNLVRNNGIGCSMKPLHTFNSDYICTCALNIGSHSIKEVRHINYMWLFSCILQNGIPISETCC